MTPDTLVRDVGPAGIVGHYSRLGMSWRPARTPAMPRIARKAPAALHQHGVTVIDAEADAWALVADDGRDAAE